MRISQTALDDLVRQIVAEVHPVRIVVFGSAARDEAGMGSDIDLLVVVPEGAHRRRTAQLLYRNVHRVPVPFDLIIATPSDLARHGDNPNLIYFTALREGKTVYAA